MTQTQKGQTLHLADLSEYTLTVEKKQPERHISLYITHKDIKQQGRETTYSILVDLHFKELKLSEA